MARTYGVKKEDKDKKEEVEEDGVNLSLLLGKQKPQRKAEEKGEKEVVGHFRTAQVAQDYTHLYKQTYMHACVQAHIRMMY
jgi:formate-dependent nitrite reductase cytochrome c552 subunit